MNRREFIILSVATAAGCAGNNGVPGGAPAVSVVDAGPAADYAADGFYDRFQRQGFFLIRRRGELVALSSYCTHRRCKLETEPDRSFYCKCHGSCFDAEGKVTEGPADRDLPKLPTTVDPIGRLLVTVPNA